ARLVTREQHAFERAQRAPREILVVDGGGRREKRRDRQRVRVRVQRSVYAGQRQRLAIDGSEVIGRGVLAAVKTAVGVGEARLKVFERALRGVAREIAVPGGVGFREQPEQRGIRLEQLFVTRLFPVARRRVAEEPAVDAVVQPAVRDGIERPLGG